MNRILLALVLLGIAHRAELSAQPKTTPVTLSRTESHDLASKVNGRAYQVLVSLPRTYTRDAGARFPVIYLTDANWTFATTAQSHFLLAYGGLVPDAIIVGIVRTGVDDDPREGNTAGAERSLDLTPTRVIDEEQKRSQEYKREVRTGGAAGFLRVIREELIPFVEGRYRTNGDRTYIGYSLGGLFGGYVLFQSPETFKRMILVSPSLGWDNDVVFKQEEAYAAQHKSLPVRLFMTVGEGEIDTMLGPMRRMENLLKRRGYQELYLQTRIFEGEVHLSSFPVAVTRGLRIVFADPSKR